jgi:hypothetical protein
MSFCVAAASNLAASLANGRKKKKKGLVSMFSGGGSTK